MVFIFTEQKPWSLLHVYMAYPCCWLTIDTVYVQIQVKELFAQNYLGTFSGPFIGTQLFLYLRCPTKLRSNKCFGKRHLFVLFSTGMSVVSDVWLSKHTETLGATAVCLLDQWLIYVSLYIDEIYKKIQQRNEHNPCLCTMFGTHKNRYQWKYSPNKEIYMLQTIICVLSSESSF